MKEVAGNLDSHPLAADWDAETESVTSAASRSDLVKAAAGADAAAASQAQAMQIQASLGELALFVAGRPSDVWWPPPVHFHFQKGVKYDPDLRTLLNIFLSTQRFFSLPANAAAQNGSAGSKGWRMCYRRSAAARRQQVRGRQCT